MSLQKFIVTNHTKLVSMTREKVAKRGTHARPKDVETKHGVHVFLDQLVQALAAEEKRDPAQRAHPDPPTNPNIAKTAALHGEDLLGVGFSIDEVVHDYGDVCQAVTELAVELGAAVSVAEFHTLNRCLDNAIAAAVTAWTSNLETAASARDEKLRHLVSVAISVSEMLRSAKVAPAGATATTLMQNLEKMRSLLDPASSS